MKLLSKVQLILGYSDFFKEKDTPDSLSLISHLPINSVLLEISALNYRLKPLRKLYINRSFEFQKDELWRLTQSKNVYSFYANVLDSFKTKQTEYAIIFNRPACIYALEEILNSDVYRNRDDVLRELNLAEKNLLLIYLLIINDQVTNILNYENYEGSVTIESINPKLIPLNELIIPVDQFHTPYRGYILLKYLSTQTPLKSHIKNYLFEEYGVSPRRFIYAVMSMYYGNIRKSEEAQFYFKTTSADYKFFNKLSSRFNNHETFKLLSIRKSPFIHIKLREYCISDLSFLIEKCYSQLITDLWFDHVKNAKKNRKSYFTVNEYFGYIGAFFEYYLTQILRECFTRDSYVLMLFDELKIRIEKKKEIELCDVYIRSGRKVLIGEVKSNTIPDKIKYASNPEGFYGEDKNSLFKTFGLYQLANAIRNFFEHIDKLDHNIPTFKKLKIYPCLIVNEKVFQTPLLCHIFTEKFASLVDAEKFSGSIMPLNIIHISDIEYLECRLEKRPRYLWDILNQCDFDYSPPFYQKITQYGLKKEWPDKIFTLFKKLIEEYNPEGLDIESEEKES